MCYSPLSPTLRSMSVESVSTEFEDRSAAVKSAGVPGSANIMKALLTSLQLGFGLMIAEKLSRWLPSLQPTFRADLKISPLFLVIWVLGFMFSMNILLRARFGRWFLVAAIGYVAYELAGGGFGTDTAAVISSFIIGLAATTCSHAVHDIPLSRVLARIQVLSPGGMGEQAVLKSVAGHSQGEQLVLDDTELQRHQQLERLYISTKAAKHFQRELVRGAEGIVSTGVKQLEIASKLADDCCKYGRDGPSNTGALARASLHFGTAHSQIERERDSMHRSLGTQVAEPLRALVMGAPLEDARLLTQRYERLRQEAEAQASDVGRKQVRSKEANTETDQKLKIAEQKMGELASAMSTLGREAAAAMTAVEIQQQRLTLQRLIAMVDAERTFHQRAAQILGQLQSQMSPDAESSDSGASSRDCEPPTCDKVNGAIAFPNAASKIDTATAAKDFYYLAEVIHPFESQEGGDLNLSIGDYVVVRQESSNGWSEGESRGKAGWFPSSYVEKRQHIPANKVTDVGLHV